MKHFNGRYSFWGHSIQKQWGTERLDNGGFKVHGHLTPLPKVGDTVELHDGVYEFEEVEPQGNPKDLFFGQIKPKKSTEEEK